MQYAIFEGNMDKLEKKLNHIYNKCKTYGCDFYYAVVGETFKELKDQHGRPFMARFLLVEAEGTAIVNNWEFVASVEHTENGNVFSGILGIEVPERYYNSQPICEHCNTNRYRKYTYIIRNRETNEFRQVGKACLKDYTGGMSAEAVARYISLFDSLIEGEAPDKGCHIEHYLDKTAYLQYAAETIRLFGYVKAGDTEKQSTALRALDYYEASHGRAVSREYLKHLQDEMERNQFDGESQRAAKRVEDALAWISEQKEDSTYIHNLKTVCSLPYVAYKNAGILASLFVAYDRAMEREKRWQEKVPGEISSVHVGTVNGRVIIDAKHVILMSSFNNEYGISRLYKIIGHDGNTYVWKTGKLLPTEFISLRLAGTVKAHTEFRGIKQTQVTRCQIMELKQEGES